MSKKLDHIVQGWPACLRAVAVSCKLLQEADKFSLGPSITIYAPHQVLSPLEQKGNLWFTAGRMGRYQAILLNNPNVSLQIVSKLNTASLFLGPDSASLRGMLEGGGSGCRGIKGRKKWDNCNSIINKIYLKIGKLINKLWYIHPYHEILFKGTLKPQKRNGGSSDAHC